VVSVQVETFPAFLHVIKLYGKRTKKVDLFTAYTVVCNDCNLSYIGESGRKLSTRMNEHLRAIRNSNSTYATAHHVKTTGHTTDISNPTIITVEQNLNKRLWLEAGYIKNTPCLKGNIGKRTIPDAWLTGFPF